MVWHKAVSWDPWSAASIKMADFLKIKVPHFSFKVTKGWVFFVKWAIFCAAQNMAHLTKKTHPFVILNQNCHFCYHNLLSLVPKKSAIFCVLLSWLALNHCLTAQNVILWMIFYLNTFLRIYLTIWLRFCEELMIFY